MTRWCGFVYCRRLIRQLITLQYIQATLHHNQTHRVVHSSPLSSPLDISFPCLCLSNNKVGLHKKGRTLRSPASRVTRFNRNSDDSVNTFMIWSNSEHLTTAHESKDRTQACSRRSCCAHLSMCCCILSDDSSLKSLCYLLSDCCLL